MKSARTNLKFYDRDGKTEMPVYHAHTDAERGIIEVVYQCNACGDTDTERLFADKPVPEALGCVKCGAGMRGNPGGMFPLVPGEQALAN